MRAIDSLRALGPTRLAFRSKSFIVALLGLTVSAGCKGSEDDGGLDAGQPAELNPPGRVATLESVLSGDTLATGDEIKEVQVVRARARLKTRPEMGLLKGDRIASSADARALIRFASGYEVIVAAGTEAVILDSSIRMTSGQSFVKKLRNARGAFHVETSYVLAGVEGTEFLVKVERDDVVSVAVLEGSVTVESKTQAWPAVTYETLEQGTIRGQEPPQRMEDLEPAEVQGIRQWVERAERLTPAWQLEPDSLARVEDVDETTEGPPREPAGPGIRLDVSYWVPDLDEISGWWGAVSAGDPPDKLINWSHSVLDSLLLPPGRYDIYWRQDSLTEPFLLADSIQVEEGGVREVDVVSGIELAPGSWAAEPDEGSGWWGAVRAGDPSDRLLQRARSPAARLVAAPGRYDVYWRQDSLYEPFLLAAGVEVSPGELARVDASLAAPLDSAPDREAFFSAIDTLVETLNSVTGDLNQAYDALNREDHTAAEASLTAAHDDFALTNEPFQELGRRQATEEFRRMYKLAVDNRDLQAELLRIAEEGLVQAKRGDIEALNAVISRNNEVIATYNDKVGQINAIIEQE